MSDRLGLVALLLVAGVGAGLLLSLRGGDSGPLTGFDRFPFPMLPADHTTYDPEKLRIWIGGPTPPGMVEINGVPHYPVFHHPDPQLVAQQNGQRLYFPMIIIPQQNGPPQLTTPPLPPHNRPLSGTQLHAAERYQTEEGTALLQSFRDRFKP